LGTGSIRGRRNTMLSDADINYERHARAAVGAVIASVRFAWAVLMLGSAGDENRRIEGAAIVRT
jgi:cyanuric acid amidohydrolase